MAGTIVGYNYNHQHYRRRHEELGYWRSTANHEVDFMIGIEAKATRKVGASDLRGLAALAEEKIVRQLFSVSEDPIETRLDPLPPLANLSRGTVGRQAAVEGRSIR